MLARAGTPTAAAHVILDGMVHVTAADRPARTLGAGATIGGIEMLGELTDSCSYEATTRVRTLACTSSAMLDVIEDHPDLGLAVLARVAHALLAATVRLEPQRILTRGG